MSVKTIRKRISLIAVSALGAGLMSVVVAPSANAAVGDLTVASNGTVTLSTTEGSNQGFGVISGTGGVTTSASVVMYDTGTLVVHADGATTNTVVTVTGGTITGFVGTATLTGLNTIGSTGANDFAISIKPTGAGTPIVVTSYKDTTGGTLTATTGGTVVDTITATVITAAQRGKVDPSQSYAAIQSASQVSTGAALTSSGDDVASIRVANGGQGYIGFTLRDSSGTVLPATATVGCSATGGAVCSFTSGTFTGASASTTYDGDSYDTIYVAQGITNAAIDTTVTITVDGATWLTKSLVLLGEVASIELGGTETTSGGGIYGLVSTSDGDIGLKVKDSLGRLLTSASVSVSGASYNTSVVGFGAFTTGASTTDATDVSFQCSAIRGSSEVQVSAVNASLKTITSNKFKVYCVGAADKYTAALDKATYVPGDIATLTITAKDSTGNPAADSSTLGTGASIAGSNMTAVTAPTTTDTFTAGVKKYKFIVGSTEGSYQMSVDLPAIDPAATVAYTIKASSATVSNAEVLSAIVKLIASINKQIRQLQKQLRR